MAAALGLALLAAGATASDPMMGGPSPTIQPAYSRFREFSYNMRMRLDAVSSRLQGKDTQIYSEMNNLPPKPLEVFQYGPSRPAWMRNPKKYRYQYVCVVATTGSVEEGIWHRRRSPIKWKYEPPFYVRIVRPNPAGMLDHLLTAKKIRLANKEVTIRKTDNTTGRFKETTRPMMVVERIDADEMPEHIAEMIQAQEEGRAWVDTREDKGRWGPSNLKEDHEEGVMELLGEAGIETQEEIDDITKVINKKTGEKFDLKRAFDFGDTRRGYSRWTQAMAKKAKQRRRAEQKREKELQRQQKKQQQ